MEELEQLEVGDKVKHPKFGQGTVMFRSGGTGENAKATVKFGSDVGEKKLALKYAKLKKIIDRPTLPAEGEVPPGEAPAAAAEEKA